jgi:hypothetical protein
VLYESKSNLSVKQAAELTHNMYELNAILPESKQARNILLQLSESQGRLKKIIDKYYRKRTH